MNVSPPKQRFVVELFDGLRPTPSVSRPAEPDRSTSLALVVRPIAVGGVA